jgi:hypothetical protein
MGGNGGIESCADDGETNRTDNRVSFELGCILADRQRIDEIQQG